MTVAPIDIFASFVRLDQDGRAHPEQRKFDPGRDGWQLMVFHLETDADAHAGHWEVHTEADEVVSCLTGGIRLCFRPEQSVQEEQIKLTPGTALIVPRGRWHRVELDAPSDILSLTVARGSHLEKRTEA